MAQAEGYTYKKRRDGSVVVFHHGRLSATLRDAEAAEVIAGGATPDQDLLARFSGLTTGGKPQQVAKRDRPTTTGIERGPIR